MSENNAQSSEDQEFEEVRQEFDPLTQEKPTIDPRAKRRIRKSKATGGKPGRPRKGTMAPGTYQTVWAPQRREDGSPGPQYALLSCPFQEIFFGGARGGGKSVPLDENVLYISGYRKMRDVAIGDEICAPNGEVTKVVGVYPQGVEDVFAVTLVDGRHVRASEDHLWRIKVRGTETTASTSRAIYLLESGEDVLLPVKTLDHWVAIASIEYDGKAETQCIKVDRPDGLFVTNDHIITHNTDGAIGVWLEHAARYGKDAKGLFLRRQYANLKDVLDRMNTLFPKIGAQFNKGEGVWLFPNGANLKLGHLWDEQATNAYQGHQYCVAEGTPILMGDGTYRPIQDVFVGDLVMTLEGPKPVLATMAPRLSPCVRAEIFDETGEKVGEQIHPEDHPVLTSVSWLPSGQNGTSQSFSPPQRSRVAGSEKESRLSSHRGPAFRDSSFDSGCPTGQKPHISPAGLCRSASQRQEYPAQWQSYTTLLDVRRENKENYACSADGQIGCTKSDGVHEGQQRLPPLFVPVVLFEPAPRSSGSYSLRASESRSSCRSERPSSTTNRCSELRLSGLQQLAESSQSQTGHSTLLPGSDGTVSAQTGTETAADSQAYYRFYPGFRGERSPHWLGNARYGAPLPVDAEQPIPFDNSDGEGLPHRHSRQGLLSYVHPYTGQLRGISQDLRVGTAELRPWGLHKVYDLTVYDANHYVTSSGLINANTAIFIEEVTQWPTPAPIDMMRATLRSAHGVPTKLVMTGNPGGSGHGWVRERYVSPAPQGYTPILDPKTGSSRIYIPSRVTDNTILMKNDPNYINNLKQSGSENLVKAWLEGDWNIVAGGYFSDIIDPDTHYLKPFEIPDTWRYRRSFDWGSAAPAALGIWAISDGNPVPDLDGFVFPRGSLILVKEWYTVDRKDDGTLVPNQGQRLTNLALGNGIAQRSLRYNFSGCVADPSIFAKPGRESIYDEMRKGALEAGHNLIFSPADNNRVAGWQRMRDMLQNARDLRPEKEGMWIFETCHHWIRTVPVLQRDERNPDDIDTGSEDHLADSSRYIAQTGVRSMVVGDLSGR